MAEEKPVQHDSDRPDGSVDAARGLDVETPQTSHALEPDHPADEGTNTTSTDSQDVERGGASPGSTDEARGSEADMDATFTRAQEAINRLQESAVHSDDAVPDDRQLHDEAGPAAETNDDPAESAPDAIISAAASPTDEAAAIPPPIDTAPSDPPAPARDPASLAELDESIADEADALLDGDFESVEEVLDDVFTHHANEFDPSRKTQSKRRDSATDKLSAEKRRDGKTAHPADDAPGERRDVGKHTELAAMSDDRNTGGMPGGKPDLRKISMPESKEAIIDRSSAAASASDGKRIQSPATQEPSISQESTDDAVEIDVNDDPLEVTAHTPSLSVDDERKTDPEPETTETSVAARSTQQNSDSTAKLTWRDWLQRALGVIEATLRFINWPLRWLPSSARPMIDWVALTLVFWIPIVWVVALVIVG